LTTSSPGIWGETASKLRLIFDSIKNTLGVFFFDEFDAIVWRRSGLLAQGFY